MIKRIISTETIEVPQEPPWMTAEELEDKCCYPVAPAACEVMVSPWSGYSSDEVIEELGLKLDADGFDEDGYYVDLRLISGPNGCGTQEVVQKVPSYNCCLDVPRLLWDYDNSAEVIGAGGCGAVFVTDGQLPLYVEVRGDGFYLDKESPIRDGIVNSRSIIICAREDACGSASIYINDGCTSVSGEVRTTNGRWVAEPFDPCLPPVTTIYDGGSFQNGSFTSGRYLLYWDTDSGGACPSDVSGLTCPGLEISAGSLQAYCTAWCSGTFGAGCCTCPSVGSAHMAQHVTHLFKWVC